MTNYEDFIRQVGENEEPTRKFVITTANGQWECDNPMYMMDIVTGDYFADCDDVVTQTLMGTLLLRDVAAALAAEGIWAQVYDGNGLLYDGYSKSCEFENSEPLILDSWDAWTVLKGLIESERIIIHEKVPLFTAEQPHVGCEGCYFNQNGFCSVWRTDKAQGGNLERICPYSAPRLEYDEYCFVDPALMPDPSYKNDWVPISERKDEYPDARRSEKDRKQ